MPDADAKRVILSALQYAPDFSRLHALPRPDGRKGTQLLRWLDQSGLALSLLKRLQDYQAFAQLPPLWYSALEHRLARNSTRLQDMLREFQRVNLTFQSKNILVVTLKGFSLFPDFCKDLRTRHQTDFDFLLAPNDIGAAADALRSLGYSTPCLSHTAESSFMTPLSHVPSNRDDLYAMQRHRQVDLHVSLSESSAWFKVPTPADCLLHSVPISLDGINFYGLSLADQFIAQVLHLFRHSFRSWIRLSWSAEVARCLELHQENTALWTQVTARAGNTLPIKRIFAFVLSLTNHLFRAEVPSHLRAWTAEGMTQSMQVWLDHFSIDWALSDWPGDLRNLFLAPDFIPDEKRRRQYVASRLLPKGERMNIETMPTRENKKSLAWHLERYRYLARRACAHLKDFFLLPLRQFRWNRALSAARRDLGVSPMESAIAIQSSKSRRYHVKSY